MSLIFMTVAPQYCVMLQSWIVHVSITVIFFCCSKMILLRQSLFILYAGQHKFFITQEVFMCVRGLFLMHRVKLSV